MVQNFGTPRTVVGRTNPAKMLRREVDAWDDRNHREVVVRRRFAPVDRRFSCDSAATTRHALATVMFAASFAKYIVSLTNYILFLSLTLLFPPIGFHDRFFGYV